MVTGQQANDVPESDGRAVAPGWPAPPDETPGTMPGGRGSAAVTAAFWVALAALVVSVGGLTVQLLPRQFSAGQQQRIMAWEVQGRWRDFSAGQVFPGKIGYGPPAVLDDIGSSLALTANRLGIARQASCRAATDPAAAAVLGRHGCEAVLRATYTDDTDTYVATVGVVPFPSPGQAEEAQLELGAKRLRMSDGRIPGVRPVPLPGTPGAGFTASRRQLSGNVVSGPYLVMYAVGYADDRPLVPVSADNYADAEMTSFGKGVAEAAANALGTPPPPPHCPGAPGC